VNDLLERLAALEHEQWVHWARDILETEPQLSETRRRRWRSLLCPFEELSEEAKELDRKWARQVLEIVSQTRGEGDKNE
jgi:hypothetical protein